MPQGANALGSSNLIWCYIIISLIHLVTFKTDAYEFDHKFQGHLSVIPPIFEFSTKATIEK